MNNTDNLENEILPKFEKLIEEGKDLFSIKFISHDQPPLRDERLRFNNWTRRANFLIKSVSPKQNTFFLQELGKVLSSEYRNYYEYFENLLEENFTKLTSLSQAIKQGFIFDVEKMIYLGYTTDLLKQTKIFMKKDYRIASAVIGRVIIEQCLKRALVNNGIIFEPKLTGGQLNLLLKEKKIINDTFFIRISYLIKIGNVAAHENKAPDKKELKTFIDEIENDIMPMM